LEMHRLMRSEISYGISGSKSGLSRIIGWRNGGRQADKI